jgi:hypothetical protein
MEAPIIIYEMGNAGSSSLFTMLTQTAGIKRPVYRVNTLRDDGIGRNIIDHVGWEEKRHIVDSIKVRRMLANAPFGEDLQEDEKWKWITPVCEPISRNMSAFFQHHDLYIPNMLERWERDELAIDEIRDTFIQLYDHMIPLRWFDDEYKALFKLDVYDVPFNKDEGYIVMQTNVFDILLVRSEGLSSMPAELFEEFIGASGLEVQQVLVGENRPYADVYKAFKEQVRFPKQFVDALYDTPYMKTFYSAGQIDEFRQNFVGE